LNAHQKLCPKFFAGELYLSGCGTAGRYNNVSDEVNRAFSDNPFLAGSTWYKTGDIVKWNGDGELEFIGRQDNQVKIQGNRVELSEIEKALKKHPGVKEAVVLYKTSAASANLAAFIVPAGKEASQGMLQAYLSSMLPKYMIPNRYIFVSNYPATPNGKVDKSALLHMLDINQDGMSKGVNSIAAAGSVKQKIHEIWLDLLEVNEVGYDVNFFDAGGYSLLLYKLSKAISRELNVTVSFLDLMTSTTINSLAERIEFLLKGTQPEEKETPKRNRFAAIKNRAKRGGE
jgi:hypothetical protein